VQKIANPAGGPSTIRYYHDDARIVEEEDAGGATQATYVYGNYIDEVLTMDRGGQTYYYHPNSLWSVEAITDATGAAVERYSYDAYGLPSVFDGAGSPVAPNAWGTPHSAIGNPWTFTGRQLDEETGLYYYRARYYDCGKGRFLQRDSLGYVENVNLYEYVRGRPTVILDPYGLAACTGNEECEQICERKKVSGIIPGSCNYGVGQLQYLACFKVGVNGKVEFKLGPLSGGGGFSVEGWTCITYTIPQGMCLVFITSLDCVMKCVYPPCTNEYLRKAFTIKKGLLCSTTGSGFGTVPSPRVMP
jgi:RHS repeat-associated protein